MDQIAVTVGEFPDQFDGKTFRIDGYGEVSLPLAGRVHAAGLTTHELEEEVKKNLGSILKKPDVVINVTEYVSQSYSVLGAVNTPGIHEFSGQKSIFDALSISQGLTESAGTTVKITRQLKWGVVPLAGATVDDAAQVSTATIRLKEISRNGTDNISIMPGDTIFVPKADLVYAVGSVTKPGGFPIGENETLSALQVVSLASGLDKFAAADKARILRSVPGNPTRIEIAVNIKKLMAGKTPDIPLRADDILFIPNSGAKSAASRTIEAIVSTASGVAIYGSRVGF
jgi:polysaccharide export outer membrane protein